MTILLPAPPKDDPLVQGDVLADLATYVADHSKLEAVPDPVMQTGYCMIVSRPCNAFRAKAIIVATLVKKALPQQLRDGGATELVELFRIHRDGRDMPDTMYLGELPGTTDRYYAKLDSLRTVYLPEEKGARRDFVGAHRTARLDPEFARDLHSRLFNSLSSMGFDDERWWSDADLELVLARAEADVARYGAEKKASEARLIAIGATEGAKRDAKDEEAVLARAQKALEASTETLDPLKTEWERRRRGGVPASSSGGSPAGGQGG